MKKLLCLILCIVMCASMFVACGEDANNNTDATNDATKETVVTSTTEPTAGTETASPSSSAEATNSTVTTQTAKPSANQSSTPSAIQTTTNSPTATPTPSPSGEPVPTLPSDTSKVVSIPFEAFGGVACDGPTDGVNNVSKMKVALRNIKKYPKGSAIEFKANTTYYFGNAKGAAISVQNLKGYTIKGSNTTILIDAPDQYMNITGCEDVTIQGLNFNYRTKPYAFTKSVDAVDTSKKTADVTLDRSLGITKRFSAPSAEFFGVVNREDGRYHMSISSIAIIDAAKNKYRITFNNTFGSIESRINLIKTSGMIVPVPNIGHSVEQAFTLISNTNLTMKDCNVWSACKFMFFLRQNEEQVLFENFNVTPDPKEYSGNIRIVGWRDGFHCKENRAKLIWKNCTLKWVYDDMFNISASMLKVTAVSGKTVTLTWPETNGVYSFIKAGDTISFYNVSTGKELGSATVSSVSGGDVVLNKTISGVSSGVYAVVNSLVAPGSQLINCNIKGTMRFRGPLTATNCNIHCTRMWFAMENDLREGPVAEDITFKNCKFTFDSSSGKYIEIFTKGSSSTASGNYHVNNILFDGCSGISSNNISCSYGSSTGVYTIK